MYALSYLSADFVVLIFHATMLIVRKRFLCVLNVSYLSAQVMIRICLKSGFFW